jgi:diaminopimelate decarboxylase
MSTQEAKIPRLAGLLGGIEKGQMHVGGIPVRALAEQVGTPFYVYNGDALVKKVRAVRSALGPETELYFSIKANPSLGVCQLVAREGVGAELASIGELHVAEKAGFPAERAIFAGPGKTNEELERAVRWGIESVNVESAGELERLSAVAAQLGKTARACLRINPKEQVKGAQMRMGGGPTQFGIDEEDLGAVIERFQGRPHLSIVGIHVYVGSQLFDIDALIANCQHILDIGVGVSQRLKKPLQSIDLGGGFAIPYFDNSPDFDLSAFSTAYRAVVDRCKTTPALAQAKLIIELGRYLVAESGLYVTRVIDVKSSRGTTYVVADGGMNHHITATGNFGQVFRKPYPVAILNRMTDRCDAQVAVVGPCCTPLDVIGQKIAAPKVEPGDLVGIFYSGAYGYSASSLGFLSHPTPAEVLVMDGKSTVLRDAGKPDGVLAGQRGI